MPGGHRDAARAAASLLTQSRGRLKEANLVSVIQPCIPGAQPSALFLTLAWVLPDEAAKQPLQVGCMGFGVTLEQLEQLGQVVEWISVQRQVFD